MNPLRIQYREVEALIPYVRNPRTHTAEQVAKLAGSIVEYGSAASSSTAGPTRYWLMATRA